MLKKGDCVCLKAKIKATTFSCPEGRDNNKVSKIRNFLSDIEGGVFLERDLHGCRYWNIEDLKRAPKNMRY